MQKIFMNQSLLIIPFRRNTRKSAPAPRPLDLPIHAAEDPPLPSPKSRFYHQPVTRVLNTSETETTPFIVQGKKLVAESVMNVRPGRCDLFVPPDTVSATLPIATGVPSRRLSMSRCQAARPVGTPELIGGRDIRRCRRQLTALATQRRRVIERIQRTQRAWADEEWKSRTEVFIKTRGTML